MTPDRVSRAVELLLDQALEAVAENDWPLVAQRAEMVLALAPENEEATRLLAAARIAAPQARGPRADQARQARQAELAGPVRSLDEVLRDVVDLVPFPSVATRIIEQIDDETGTIDELARLIGSDPALTARLLRVANSAHYARRQAVGTTREAIVLLGAAEVRSLALATCVVSDSASPSVVSRSDFWRFAITVALVSDLLARTAGSLRGEAFTAGLLHNIGVLALDLYSPHDLQRALELKVPERRRLHDREQAVFGFTDAELGAALAREWRLPTRIADAIAKHGRRPDELAEGDFLALCVVRARILLRAHGLSDGVERSDPRPPPEEWTKPPLNIALARMGGIDGIVQRVDSLIEQSI